jgi:alpha-beta hydrolase superfamily lysophospholipase
MSRTAIERADRARHSLGMTLSTYAEHPTWRRYQAFFPEGMRCTAANTPREEWWSWRGLDVHLDRLAGSDAKPKVVVLHGAGAYGRVMAPAAVIAQRYGYETVSPDLPGYGLTRCPWSRMDYGLWIDCVCDLVDREIARDGRPVVLFGVSLGGLLAYQVASRGAHVRGVVATTLADPRETATRRELSRFPWHGTFGLAVLSWLRVFTDGLPLPMAHVSKMDGISNDPALAALCKSDRMGGGNWVPARFLRTLMTTSPAIEPEDFDRCPVLLAHPGVDRMTDIAVSRRFFDRLKAPKRMVVLEGASHMPTEHPGVDQLEAAVTSFLDGLG